MTINILHYEAKQLQYQIIKSKTRRRLTIKVSLEGQLSAHAPWSMKDDEIHEFVVSKAAWVFRKITEFQQHKVLSPVNELQYTDGEPHHYLGKAYTLKMNIEINVMPTVEVIEDNIVITVSKDKPKWVKTLLHRFYQEQAINILTARFHELIKLTPWVKDIPMLSFRTMKSRWGSCSHDKRIRLNYHLVKTPIECIDHVILHELCHLQVMDHSNRFYQLLASVEPDWKKNKKALDKLGFLLS